MRSQGTTCAWRSTLGVHSGRRMPAVMCAAQQAAERGAQRPLHTGRSPIITGRPPIMSPACRRAAGTEQPEQKRSSRKLGQVKASRGLVTQLVVAFGLFTMSDSQKPQDDFVCASKPDNATAGSSNCNVCDSCCRDWLSGPSMLHACEACVASECRTSNSCDPNKCNVCRTCCDTSLVLAGHDSCDACVAARCDKSFDRRCAVGPYDCNGGLLKNHESADNTNACTKMCLAECWQRPWSACKNAPYAKARTS